MVCPIRCYECGENLSIIYEFYNAVKIALYEKAIGEQKRSIAMSKIDLKPDIIKSTSIALDAVGIHNICCRAHVLGNTDFDIEL